MIDNDDLHGASEIWFDAPLDAGPHSLRLESCPRLGGRGLYMKWVGPGVPLDPARTRDRRNTMKFRYLLKDFHGILAP